MGRAKSIKRLCTRKEKTKPYQPPDTQQSPQVLHEVRIDDQNTAVMETTPGPGTNETTTQVVKIIHNLTCQKLSSGKI